MPQKMFRLTDEQICKLKKVSELRGCSQTDLIRGFIDSLDEEPPDTQGDTHRDTQEIHGDERSSGTPTSGRTGSKERVDGAEHPSTLFQVWSIRLTVASIPQPVNESA